MTDFTVDAFTCYHCDTQATSGWGVEDCQDFNEKENVTINCGDDTHCISAYGKAAWTDGNAANKDIEIHGCTYPDWWEGGYL